MLKYKHYILFVILNELPSILIGQNIQLSIYNKTGYTLDSVSFDHYFLGKIDKDSCVFLSGIDEIIMQGNVPLYQPFGLIEGKNRPNKLRTCGTKSKKKNTGSLAFDISIYEVENNYRLYWKKHE